MRYDASGQMEDVTPKGFNARTRVHEYGGAAYMVADGTVYFSNDVALAGFNNDPLLSSLATAQVRLYPKPPWWTDEEW